MEERPVQVAFVGVQFESKPSCVPNSVRRTLFTSGG